MSNDDRHVKGRPYPDIPRGPNGKLDQKARVARGPRIQDHREGMQWMRSFASEMDARERDGYTLERIIQSGVNSYEVIWRPLDG